MVIHTPVGGEESCPPEIYTLPEQETQVYVQTPPPPSIRIACESNTMPGLWHPTRIVYYRYLAVEQITDGMCFALEYIGLSTEGSSDLSVGHPPPKYQWYISDKSTSKDQVSVTCTQMYSKFPHRKKVKLGRCSVGLLDYSMRICNSALH
jgi:hypothetical protein